MKILKLLKPALSLLEGKKRGLGGLAFVLVDILAGLGYIDEGTAVQLKGVAGSLLTVGVVDALRRAR